ncbi:alpha/beta hydrolase [Pedobacter sp. KR3-3]|uniref:Alpha/beta hydrolase n=1 Tax=Pedobacter albus TaxID=3113905 RepID=A0ABU7I426_9SPHI|nr:alpha/beta hydrolase [Pedobacter sp. KR3-3]MEE1944218.1 alpha/beta hydrolase [Pedobacter sp. KR3-3]
MKKITLCGLLFSYFATVQAQPQVIPLYEKNIPNSKKTPANYVEQTDSSGLITKVSVPTLTAYFPKKVRANGTAIIIAPGGGYRLLAPETGIELAKAFNEIGITAFLLKYRLPSDEIMIDKSIAPLQDGQMAIKIVRDRAKEWNLLPHKIGMVGLSAGGHLVSTLGTQLDRIVIENAEKANLRPDFMILLYPVIIYDTNIPRTRENLIGKTPSQQLLKLYSTDQSVNTHTPPTFLVHAADDDVIPVQNSLAFFKALQKSKVKAEMHILQSGGHGFGLTDLNSKTIWFELCRSWLTENGF